MIMTVVGFWTVALLALYSANFGESQLNDPVPFPPALPTPLNIVAICRHGDNRKRYPKSSIPSSWSSHFRRRAVAINRLESWYKHCCTQETQMTLCCAQQAWKEALSFFCLDEFSTKTAAYECCTLQDAAQWMCFSTDPTNPNYSPTPGYRAPASPKEQGFFFRSNECVQN